MRREDGTWLIDGMVGLDELKQLLGVASLPGEDPEFHTLGGYLMARLNRVPMVADRVTAGDYLFEIVEMDGRRVDRVLIMPASSHKQGNEASLIHGRSGPVTQTLKRALTSAPMKSEVAGPCVCSTLILMREPYRGPIGQAGQGCGSFSACPG